MATNDKEEETADWINAIDDDFEVVGNGPPLATAPSKDEANAERSSNSLPVIEGKLQEDSQNLSQTEEATDSQQALDSSENSGREQRVEDPVDLPDVDPRAVVEPPVVEPRVMPGVYWIYPGSAAGKRLDDDDVTSTTGLLPSSMEHSDTEAEVELVFEPEKDDSPVIEEKPVKRKMHLRVVVTVIILGALIIGLTVGLLMSESGTSSSAEGIESSTPPPPTPAPVPVSELVEEFRSSLPIETIAEIDATEPPTPQQKAFEWVTSDDHLPTQGTDPLKQMTQRFALATLYYATNGDSWTNSSGWLDSSLHECRWVGCNCTGTATADEEEWIVKLDLNKNGLAGSLPRELGLLSAGGSLQFLSLGENSLTGSIPTELGKLLRLMEVHLFENRLSGSIPSELGYLVNLESLYLAANNIIGPIPTELSNLSQLSELVAWKNQISGSIPTELGNLVSMNVLFLSENALTGTIPTEIGLLSNLIGLALHVNQLDGTIPIELSNLVHIETLFLSTNALTGAIPTDIGQLSKIVDLALNENQLNGMIPTELGNLVNMKKLYLRTNSLSGPIPTEIGQLSGLTELTLRENRLSGTIPTELSYLVNLGVLHLSGNALTGMIPTEFAALTSLTEVWLYNNTLSGQVPDSVCNVIESNGVKVLIDCMDVECSCGCFCIENGT